MKKSINSPVAITSVGFDAHLGAYPRSMEWAGKTYRFIDKGIRVTSRRGESVASTVTLSDGLQDFCLRWSSGLWTLISVS